MMLPSILSLSKQLIRQALQPGNAAVDATVGNGHDTLFLAETVGAEGRVYGFDIQAEALQAARRRLEAANLEGRVTLFKESHHRMAECLPAEVCAAFEFRHGSWLCDEVYERLKARNLALCIADNENFWTPPEITASYAYFRLRDEGYTQEDIVRWADTVRDKTTGCSDVYVYFKHEEEGKGPEFAAAFIEALGESL